VVSIWFARLLVLYSISENRTENIQLEINENEIKE